MKNLYLDVDGVLLGKNHLDDLEVVLAKHAKEFLAFCLDNFQCYWLTTHCNRKNTETVVNLFKTYADESVMQFIYAIKPTNWRTFKTEAIDFKSDFYWVDDQLMAYEIEILKKNKALDRWVKVDTRKEPDDLMRVMALLNKTLQPNIIGSH